jgi:ABC-type multidrug transport system fused ATPase/permease subunit
MFGMLAGLGTLLAFSSGACLTIMSMNASKDLYRNALTHIFFSPMSFFDTTPMGRILGIFSKDMDVLDNMLAEVFRQAVIMVAAVSYL